MVGWRRAALILDVELIEAPAGVADHDLADLVEGVGQTADVKSIVAGVAGVAADAHEDHVGGHAAKVVRVILTARGDAQMVDPGVGDKGDAVARYGRGLHLVRVAHRVEIVAQLEAVPERVRQVA